MTLTSIDRTSSEVPMIHRVGRNRLMQRTGIDPDMKERKEQLASVARAPLTGLRGC